MLKSGVARIREIEKKDDEALASIIREVLLELGVPKEGSSYSDASLDCMYKTFNMPRAVYYTAILNDKVVGGGGIIQLAGADESVCELTKMYLSTDARGKGFGRSLLYKCLQSAEKFHYKKVYLETMSYMNVAQKIYLDAGFQYLEAPLGNTGHSVCPVWMIKEIGE